LGGAAPINADARTRIESLGTFDPVRLGDTMPQPGETLPTTVNQNSAPTFNGTTVPFKRETRGDR
jgi:hypothetical protein